MLDYDNTIENINKLLNDKRRTATTTAAAEVATASSTKENNGPIHEARSAAPNKSDKRKLEENQEIEKSSTNLEAMAEAPEHDQRGWQQAGNIKKKRNDEPRNIDDSEMNTLDRGNHSTHNEVSEYIPITITFIEQSKTSNLIYDLNTVHALLDQTPFKGVYEGRGRTLPGKHQLVLNIKGNNFSILPTLLEIKELHENETVWPIQVNMPTATIPENFGILKNVHPTVTDTRIEAEIVRNIAINQNNNIKITEAFRIKNRNGNQLDNTWCVRLKFEGNIRPESIFYGGKYQKIHTYYPKLSICSRCSRSGHYAKNCNAAYRCGRCGRAHDMKTCKAGKINKAQRKCPNCGLQHYAGYGGCQYIQIEKQVIRQHAETLTPKTEIRKLLWSNVVSTGTQNTNSTTSTTGNINTSSTTQINNRNQQQNPEVNAVTQPSSNFSQQQRNFPTIQQVQQHNHNSQRQPIKPARTRRTATQENNTASTSRTTTAELHSNHQASTAPGNITSETASATTSAPEEEPPSPIRCLSNEILDLKNQIKLQNEMFQIGLIKLLTVICDPETNKLTPQEKIYKLVQHTTNLFSGNLDQESSNHRLAAEGITQNISQVDHQVQYDENEVTHFRQSDKMLVDSDPLYNTEHKDPPPIEHVLNDKALLTSTANP